jgi:hypothetical protein
MELVVVEHAMTEPTWFLLIGFALGYLARDLLSRYRRRIAANDINDIDQWFDLIVLVRR